MHSCHILLDTRSPVRHPRSSRPTSFESRLTLRNRRACVRMRARRGAGGGGPADAMVKQLLGVLVVALLQRTVDTAGSKRSVSHTVTFVCEVDTNDSAYVDLHWVSGGRRKLKHTFTAAGERWTTRTVPGHQFAAFLRTTAPVVAAHIAGPEMLAPTEQLLAQYTVGPDSGHVHRVRVPAVGDSVAGLRPAPPRGAAPLVDLTPAEDTAIAAAAAEAQLVRAAPARPKHILATGSLPIPQIGPRRHDDDTQRYVPGDESKWRPDAERATLVAKQPQLVRYALLLPQPVLHFTA